MLAERAQLGRPLTHHVARHTFATTITLANQVPIEVVSRLLGHRDLATTQVYAKITTDYLADVARGLEERLAQRGVVVAHGTCLRKAFKLTCKGQKP